MKIWTDYIHILTALLVITNPIGALPVFITLTRDQTLAARRNTARITATAVAIVLVVSMFLGEPLLRFFGIGLPSFRVGGGILIMMMAIAMLRGYPGETRHTPEERIDAEDKGISAATRVMGLILAAVAVEFIAGGLIQLFPSLG